MNLAFPSLQEPLIQQGIGQQLLSSTWSRFLSRLWSFLGFSNEVDVFDTLQVSFDQDCATGADTTVTADFLLPNSYKEGTDVFLFFDWMTNDTNTGNVKWDTSYRRTNGTVLGSSVSVSELSAAPGVDKTVARIKPATVSVSTLARDHYIRVVITRNGTDATDTYGGTATVLCAGIKYQVEGVGTVESYP